MIRAAARGLFRLVFVVAVIGGGSAFVARNSLPALPFARAAKSQLAGTGVVISDSSLNEISGCAVSARNPGVLWVHNDSGDGPTLYAVRLSDGRLLARLHLDGAKATDWEDMAIYKGTLVVGDIGDNSGSRSTVRVITADEPRVDTTRPDSGDSAVKDLTATASSVSLTYADGARDAEALVVDPTGATVIIDKVDGGVWRADATGVLRRVADTGAAVITGADVVPGGRSVLVRTYPFVTIRTASAGAPFDAVWSAKPRVLASPLLPQAEAICAAPDGRTAYTLSEAHGRPVRIVTIRW